jgi:hypothetical protein
MMLLLMTLPLSQSVHYVRSTYPPSRIVILSSYSRIPFACQYVLSIAIEHVENLWSLNVTFTFNKNIAQVQSIVDGGFLNAPYQWNPTIDNSLGIVVILASEVGGSQPKTGSFPPQLCDIVFNCVSTGDNAIELTAQFYEFNGNVIPTSTENALVKQEIPPTYELAAPFVDYCPSGMPDFDQKQDQWDYPPGSGRWDYCVPTATADAIWWLDSKYEVLNTPDPQPPPFIKDSFPLVESYNPSTWDDHDPRNVQPLIDELAFLMDAHGARTNMSHYGTSDFQAGLSQYLQKHHINPEGDADGSGVVDSNDLAIVDAAYGSRPGSPNWDLRADLNQDNYVNIKDRVLVGTHMGQKGMFAIIDFVNPSYSIIEEEFESGNPVLLDLHLLHEEVRDIHGHFVAVAGLNSTLEEIAISDPIGDAYEQYYALGGVPVLHTHSQNEPPCTTHNEAVYTCYDTYEVQDDTSGSTILGYPVISIDPETGEIVQAPPDEWRIVHAFTLAPVLQHNLRVSNVTPCKNVVGQNLLVCINVTIQNIGDFTENSNVTIYADSIPVETIANIVLPNGTSTTLTFTWNTIGWTKGNYTISAFVKEIPYETNTSDNTYTDGIIQVTTPGDIASEYGIIDIFDIATVALAFSSTPSDPNWNSIADINNDNLVDIFDIVVVALNFGAIG